MSTIDYIRVMQIRTPAEVGMLVRSRRKELGWTQDDLAKRLRTSRPWVVQIETGKATAQLGRVLSALLELGIELHVTTPNTARRASPSRRRSAVPAIDVDAIVESHVRKRLG